MTDLKIDTQTFELAIVDGDFCYENNCSAQNGILFYITKNMSLLNPISGVGVLSTVNGKNRDLATLLDKWKSQVKSDGANRCTWTVDANNKPVLISEYGN